MPLFNSLRGRLVTVILVTTLVALVANAVVLLLFEYRSYRAGQLENVRSRAEIIGRAASAALAFDDRKDAESALQLVSENPDVLVVALYKPDGKLFASYAREDDPVPRMEHAPAHFRSAGGRTEGFLPIAQGGYEVGTVYLSIRSDLNARLLEYVGVLAGVLVLALALAFVLSTPLQRAFTTPILNVVDAARRVIKGHDYAVRVQHRADDETGLLADAFNRMLGEVEKRSADLRHEMAERSQAEQALLIANKRKDAFLATLAHELRNPMAPVRTSVQVIRMKAPADPDIRRACEIADRQLGHLTRLLDDLLDVGRITAGKLDLRRSIVPLAPLIEAALETSRPLTDTARHELSVVLPSEPVWLDVDSVRFAQVLSNILINATKYTPEGGRIELSVRAEERFVHVTIRDNGIGIAPDNLRGIFDMFAQANPALAHSQGGLGIGLFLVRQLVEMHGGTVSADSAGPGLGSAFTVTMPAAAPPSGPAAEPAPQAGDLLRKRVLIADDNADAASTLAMLLEFAGHEVSIAHDGVQALELAGRLRPEFAILDIGMPGLTGYEVARRIRHEPWGRAMVLVAVTGWGQETDRRDATEAGFDHHVTKPADAGAVLKLLRLP